MISTPIAVMPQLFTKIPAVVLVAKITQKSKLQLDRADLLCAITPGNNLLSEGKELIYRDILLMEDFLKELPHPIPKYLLLKHADLLVKASEHSCIVLTKMNEISLVLQQQNQ